MAVTYYIDPDGVDDAGRNGFDPDQYWATLAYACGRVSGVGNKIYINPGTYIETQASLLKVGVSIEGAGTSSWVKSHYASTAGFSGMIQLVSGSVTDGNQSISNFKLDGDNYQGYKAISVYRRSHVSIHDLTVLNFLIEGIRYGGSGQTHGNEVYNCTITNSGWYYSADEHPNLNMENTLGALIHHNVITVTDRGDGHSGTGFESFAGLAECKFYNNTITCPPQVGVAWAFSFEAFYVTDLEMYNNIFSGKIDFGNSIIGVDFHHNIVGPSAPLALYHDGIQFEYTAENIIIRNNIFKNVERAIYFCVYLGTDEYIENIDIYDNIIYNIGTTGITAGAGIYFETYNIMPDTVNDINIYHNTIIANAADPGVCGIFMPSGDVVTNIRIRNNIIQGFVTAPIYENQADFGTMDYLWVENNLFYDNGNGDAPLYVDWVPSHYTEANNNIGNPNFVSSSDFHLTSASLLAIHEGYDVDIAYDYDAVAFHATTPSIGAYEYTAAGLPTVTTASITNITSEGATCGGTVTMDGGDPVTARGVCWSIVNPPTTADDKTIDGSGTGAFVSQISGCDAGTLYYVRAYATNGIGTSYGGVTSFTTTSIPVIPENWATKYRCEFADDLNLVWKIDFQENAYVGGITTLQASGDPMFFDWYGDDDIMNQNIMGSKMVLNVEAQTDFALSDLFTSDNLFIKTVVYRGAVIYWTGWIMANNYQEPYDAPAFTVSLVSVDGLGLLKDFAFTELGYTTRQEMARYVYDILALVGITSFVEFVNLYESSMNSGAGDSPLDQSGIDPALFEGKTCYDALDTILKSLNAGIRQVYGPTDEARFEIIRFVEMKNATYYGRVFTSATIKSAVQETRTQKIDRGGDASTICDVEGGTMMIIPQLKKLSVTQDYGFKGSILKNYNFEYDTFNGINDFEQWVSSSGIDTEIAAGVMPGARNGVLIDNTESEILYSMTQEVDNVVTTTDKFKMNYSVAGWGPDHAGSIYSQVIIAGSSTNYYTGTAWDAADPSGFLVHTDTFSGTASWTKKYFSVTGIPYSGTLTAIIYNCASPNSDIRALYESLEFFFTDADGIVPEEKEYEVSNTQAGQLIDREFILGDGPGFDNDHLQYNGAISNNAGLSTTLVWATRGNSENIPVIELISKEIAYQYSRQKQLIDLPVRETAQTTFLDLNGHVEDSLNKVGGVNRKFAIARATFNVKRRTWDLTLTELI